MKYSNKLVLAPMVRVGSLQMRLMAIKYGADIVYTPELIDRKIIKTSRTINENLGTIDYFDTQGIKGLVLRIHPSEQQKLVLQIGSACPNLAIQAAKIMENDVSAVDLNCGCPKKFSLQGEMGSALLENQELLISILTTLVNGLSIPVTCKIRLLYPKDGKTSIERTIELLKKIEKTGVKAIGVHCRFKDQRPREPGHWHVFDELQSAVNIPIIANGDLFSLEEINRLRTTAGKSINSFMIARGAQWNPSVFRKEGLLDYKEMIIEYLKLSVRFDMPYHNAKFTILQMRLPEEIRIELTDKIIRCRTLEELCDLFGIHSDYVELTQKYTPRQIMEKLNPSEV